MSNLESTTKMENEMEWWFRRLKYVSFNILFGAKFHFSFKILQGRKKISEFECFRRYLWEHSCLINDSDPDHINWEDTNHAPIHWVCDHWCLPSSLVWKSISVKSGWSQIDENEEFGNCVVDGKCPAEGHGQNWLDNEVNNAWSNYINDWAAFEWMVSDEYALAEKTSTNWGLFEIEWEWF